ncbi:MAG TPA: hypothetical protein VJ772_00340 [Nitrososphaeraceae archaeon]|jgi:hypothetical protein|nr:hypothetical protein [Nitrososphaeraceae archaeon]
MSDQWVTDKEEEQISKEFRYLNSVDMSTKKWRDQVWMEFSPNVLDKYKNDSRCEIGNNYIRFLAPRRDEDLTVNFELIDDRLLVQSKFFCFVPPRERKHWESHQLPREENYLK